MKFVALLLVASVAVALVSTTPAVFNSALRHAYLTKDTLDIMIIMKSKTSQVLEQVESQIFVNTNAKATTLYNELNRFTSASQKAVLEILSKFKSSRAKGFYITNRISVKAAPIELVNALLHRDDIEEIRLAKVINIEATIVEKEAQPKILEWGVSQINSLIG